VRRYDIWSEGYRVTGNSAGAELVATSSGYSFRDAVDAYAKKYPAFARYYDRERMTYWGCRLFDNEEDARKSFG